MTLNPEEACSEYEREKLATLQAGIQDLADLRDLSLLVDKAVALLTGILEQERSPDEILHMIHALEAELSETGRLPTEASWQAEQAALELLRFASFLDCSPGIDLKMVTRFGLEERESCFDTHVRAAKEPRRSLEAQIESALEVLLKPAQETRPSPVAGQTQTASVEVVWLLLSSIIEEPRELHCTLKGVQGTENNALIVSFAAYGENQLQITTSLPHGLSMTKLSFGLLDEEVEIFFSGSGPVWVVGVTEAIEDLRELERIYQMCKSKTAGIVDLSNL